MSVLVPGTITGNPVRVTFKIDRTRTTSNPDPLKPIDLRPKPAP